jgi:FixJ family two-component response regulator
MRCPEIVVVDDDSAMIAAMSGLMELHLPNVRVQPFVSPRLALAHCENTQIAAVVTDIKMKELDGLALLRGVKALRPDVPVIVLSGALDATLAHEAMSMGAHDGLKKPFQREELLTVLKLALNTYALAREVRARRLMSERISQRVEALKLLLAQSRQRPITIERIKTIVSTSRQLHCKSVASLETSLDRLWEHAHLAQARLSVARQRLNAMHEECRNGFLKRLASEYTPSHNPAAS